VVTQVSRYFSLEIIKKGVKPIKKKLSKMETFVTMKKRGSHVCIVVISKPIELETSASAQMTDESSKFNTVEFTSHFTDNIGFI